MAGMKASGLVLGAAMLAIGTGNASDTSKKTSNHMDAQACHGTLQQFFAHDCAHIAGSGSLIASLSGSYSKTNVAYANPAATNPNLSGYSGLSYNS